MKGLLPIPRECVDYLKPDKETGIGYQVVSVNLKDGRCFNQVIASEAASFRSEGTKRFLLQPKKSYQ
jgi:hypothetical protein